MCFANQTSVWRLSATVNHSLLNTNVFFTYRACLFFFDCRTLMASHLPVEVGSVHLFTQLLYILLMGTWTGHWFNKNDTNQGTYNSKELTYPLAMALLKMIFNFPKVGYVRFQERSTEMPTPILRRRVISSPPTDAEQWKLRMRCGKKNRGEADWLTDWLWNWGMHHVWEMRALNVLGCFQKQGYPKMDGL